MRPYNLKSNRNYSIIEAIVNKIATANLKTPNTNLTIPESDYELQLAMLHGKPDYYEISAPGRMGGENKILTLTALPQHALDEPSELNPARTAAPAHATTNTSYDLITIHGRAYLLSITPN